MILRKPIRNKDWRDAKKKKKFTTHISQREKKGKKKWIIGGEEVFFTSRPFWEARRCCSMECAKLKGWVTKFKILFFFCFLWDGFLFVLYSSSDGMAILLLPWSCKMMILRTVYLIFFWSFTWKWSEQIKYSLIYV